MTSLHKHDVFKSKTLYFYHAFIKSAKQYTDFQSDIAKKKNFRFGDIIACPS